MTTFTTTLQDFDTKLWRHHFPVPTEIANQFINGNNRREICIINQQIRLQCALIPYTDGYFILINKPLVERHQLKVGMEVNISIEKDSSEHGHEVPESFSMLLDQDEAGKKYFDQLTPGKKRSLIFFCGKSQKHRQPIEQRVGNYRPPQTRRGHTGF